MESIFDSLKSWIMETVSWAVNTLVQMRIEEQNATLWTKTDVCKCLGVSSKTFDEHYRYNEELGFPKELPACRWKKADVVRWCNN